MASNKRRQTFSKALRRNYVLLGLLCLLFIGSVITFGILYFQNKDPFIGRLALIICTSLIIVIIAYVIYIIVRYVRTFYIDIYSNTRRNYQRIVNQEKKMKLYDNKNRFVELDELNKTLSELNLFYDKMVIRNGKTDYSQFDIEFISRVDHHVTYESFEKNILNILDVSPNFRNALISFQYPREMKNLTEEEVQLFISTTERYFDYEDMLIVDNRNRNEMLIYIPRFDSLNYLKDSVENAIKKYCINRPTEIGYELINCKIAAVVYPYSHYEDFISDLKYAKRQGKLVNFYLPNKTQFADEKVMHEARNTNTIGKLIESISSTGTKAYDLKELSKTLDGFFSGVCNYFGFGIAGICRYNSVEDEFQNIYVYGDDLKRGENIEKQFVEFVAEHADSDDTLYFSSRKNVNQDVGRYLDKYGIESAHYYVIRDKEKVTGLIYFLKNIPTKFDSYLREALLVFSFYISNYIYRIGNLVSDANRTSQLNDILKITGSALYAVNKKDFTLTNYSTSLKQLVSDIGPGKTCYEVLYGKSKPCDKCPLKTGSKCLSTIKGNKFENSLALSVMGSNESTILLSPAKTTDFILRERFDHDLLINSYYSFFEAIQDAFLISERGFVLVFNVDNMEELILKMKSEEVNTYLRTFFTEIENLPNYILKSYVLNEKSFAIVVPNSNNNEIIELAEKIYLLSKKNYFNTTKDEITMNLSYFVFTYPFGYANAGDYAKFIKNNSVTHKNLANQDFIYVIDTKYARSASHKKYLIDILDTSISMNTFKVKLQPMLDKFNRNVIGCELLFRIADANRGGDLNTFEVINAAASEKKIHIVTSLLFDYIDHLYRYYNKQLFKKFNLQKLAINVDYTFFEDEAFLERVHTLRSKYKLPESFLEFEIAEKEINDHYNQLKDVLPKVKENNITMICDNYTGEFLSLHKISNLGFSGIKINRSVISQVDKDSEVLDAVYGMIETANSLNLTVCLVGIENSKQNTLLRESIGSFNVQGYYYYRPLDEHDLIAALSKRIAK